MAEELEEFHINPDLSVEPQFDLDKLREDAISRIQKYSGKVWTDHNIHDAGIAILEQLCFAIADISYQFGQLADFESLDLLVGKSPYFQQSPEFQRTKLNLKDFTRSILEHPAIYKVFFIPSISYPSVSGLFDVMVLTEPDASKSEIRLFLENLRDSWRPVSTAIKGFHFPPDRKIEIHLSVEVKKNDNIQQLVQEYLEEMKEFLRGKNQNENLTQYPVISIEDFADKVSFEIQSADLIARINGVSSTQNIREVSIRDSEFSFVWTLKYPRPYRLSLHPNSSISIYSNGVKLTQWKQETNSNNSSFHIPNPPTTNIESAVRTGEVEYSSLQIGFPESFGLEKNYNEPLNEDDSSSLQIKGILSTFDLIISRFIAQLEKSYALLNNQNTNLNAIAKNILTAIPGVEYIWLDFNQNYLDSLEHKTSFTDRYNAWKEYLQDVKNNLHELVSNSHRVESEYLENQINTYRFLLGILGCDLNEFDLLNPKISLEKEATKLKRLLDYWLKNRLLRVHTKKHNPHSLNRDSENGFIGLISNYLGLEFDTDSFVNGLSKITKLLTDKEKNNFHLNGNFEELIQWGRNAEAYQLNQSGNTQIINANSTSVGTFEKELSPQDIEDAIDKLNLIHDLGEGFLLIEHFEFAPEIDESTYGVQVKSKNQYLFDIEPKNKLKNLYELLRYFENALSHQKYEFEVKKIAHKQFVNYLKCEGFYQKIHGYYFTENEAKKGQLNLMNLLNLKEIQYEFFDKQYYRGPNKIDPYSYQITFCFPNWHKSYRGNARKLKIQNFIDQISPPHLVCNIKWMNPFEIHEITQTIKRYHESKTSKNLQGVRERIFELLA